MPRCAKRRKGRNGSSLLLAVREAYLRCSRGNVEPDAVFVSPDNFEILAPELHQTDNGGMVRIMHATLYASVQTTDRQVQVHNFERYSDPNYSRTFTLEQNPTGWILHA